MFGPGEAAVLDCFDVRPNSVLDAGASRDEIAHEARRLARVDAEHIVQNENLATASRTGADADRRHRDISRQLHGERRWNHLEHNEICARDRECVRVLAQHARRHFGLALYPVAAEPMHRLRLQAQMTAHGNAARDQKLDAARNPGAALELDHLRTRGHEAPALAYACSGLAW